MYTMNLWYTCLFLLLSGSVLAECKIELKVHNIENDSIVMLEANIINEGDITININLPRNLEKVNFINTETTRNATFFVSAMIDNKPCRLAENHDPNIFMHGGEYNFKKIKIKKGKSYNFKILINKRDIKCDPNLQGEFQVYISLIANKPEMLGLESNVVTL